MTYKDDYWRMTKSLLREDTSSVYDDLRKEQSGKIQSLLQGAFMLSFDRIFGNSNGIKWGGKFDNDVTWSVDTSSDQKIFLTMDSKGMDSNKINALKQLVAHLETVFIPAASKLMQG